jgi:hypothetical protein
LNDACIATCLKRWLWGLNEEGVLCKKDKRTFLPRCAAGCREYPADPGADTPSIHQHAVEEVGGTGGACFAPNKRNWVPVNQLSWHVGL